MTPSNKEIVRNYYAEVVNEKQLDRIGDYFSKDFVYHGFPYVGMGVQTDSSSGKKVVITAGAKNSPAEGKLEPGDEILMAKDEKNTWDRFSQLKHTSWGHGVVGTEVVVRVKRGEDILDITLTRGLVKGFDAPFELLKKSVETSLVRDWPDMKVHIEAMVAEEDFVACFLSQSGVNTEFERHAVWPTSAFFKLSEGKIVEGWGIGGETVLLKQLGYEIVPPENGR